MIVEIIYNLFTLIAVSILAGLIQQEDKPVLRYQIFQGVIFGMAAVLGMLHPVVFSPGLIFDGRSIMISLCGVFFGPIAVMISAGMALACRFLQGGIGALTGLMVITFSALLGLGLYYFRLRWKREVTLVQLWLFGLAVHGVMLGCMFALPVEMAWQVLSKISLPILIAYPITTVIIGKILLDIFTHKQQEAALRRSEADLKEAQSVALLGRWELDIGNGQLKWSDLVFEIFEIDRIKFGVSYKAFLEAVHPDDRERVDQAYAESMRNKQPYHIIYRLKTAGGRIKWVNEICRTEFDPQGNALRSVGIVQDITTRKMVEEELKGSKEAVERAMKAKSEFLNNVAHDFRTPLHAIMGFSSILKLEPLNAKQKKLVDIISERSRGLLSLVEDLLAVSRLESGRLELRRVEFDLKKCVLDAVDVARVELMSKEVKMTGIVREGIPRLKGDETRFHQILSNLISNAVKYTDKGEITVKLDIDLERSQPGVCRILLSVKDTGLGIPADRLSQIYDAFVRFHEFEGGKPRSGVGLGLYIVKALVDLMKGRIHVISEVGKGSEFVVILDFDKVLEV